MELIMDDLSPENLAYLIKIGQIQPNTKPAAATTKKAEEE